MTLYPLPLEFILLSPLRGGPKAELLSVPTEWTGEGVFYYYD